MVVKLGLLMARDGRRITAAEMKYSRITAGYNCTTAIELLPNCS
jgi:hypothetical protein